MAVSSIRDSALRFARGTALSQVFTIAATPLLTRIYFPAAFGQLAIFTSLYSILVAISTLKFDQAIILPKDGKSSELLACLAMILSAFFSMLLFGAMLAAQMLKLSLIPWFFFLLPLTLMVGTALSVGQQWCSRRKQYSEFGTSLLILSMSNVAAALLLSLVSVSDASLVLSFFIGNLAAAIYICVWKSEVFKNLLRDKALVGLVRLRRLFWDYREMPLYVLPNLLLTSLAYQLLPMLIAHYFGANTTGLYAVANRLLILPSILAGNVVLEVFKSEFVSRTHVGTGYLEFFDKVFFYLLLIAVPVYGLIWWFSPFAFDTIFGANYRLAGDYAQYLCLGVAGNFFIQSFAYVYVALNRARMGLLLQAGFSASQVAGFLVGALQSNIYVALLCMSVVGFGAGVVFMYLTRQMIRSHKADA